MIAVMPISVAIPSIGHSDLLVPLIDRLAESGSVERIDIFENQPSALSRMLRMRAGARERQQTFAINGQIAWHESVGSIYQVWNRAIAMAVDQHADGALLAILNDDIELAPYAIDLVAQAFDDNPEYDMIGFDYFDEGAEWPPGTPFTPGLREVEGTYRHHGIGGFAFALRCTTVIQEGFTVADDGVTIAERFETYLPSPQVDEQFEWWGGDDDLVLGILDGGRKVGVLHGARCWHRHAETSARHYPHLIEAKDRDRARVLAKWGATW